LACTDDARRPEAARDRTLPQIVEALMSPSSKLGAFWKMPNEPSSHDGVSTRLPRGARNREPQKRPTAPFDEQAIGPTGLFSRRAGSRNNGHFYL